MESKSTTQAQAKQSTLTRGFYGSPYADDRGVIIVSLALGESITETGVVL